MNGQRHTSTAARTNALLRNALFSLLMTRPFEKISLTDICKRAMVPRSTFYHYYHDKYELLNHSFDCFAKEIGISSDFRITTERKTAERFFLLLLTYLENNRATYRRIMISHSQDSVFDSLQHYLENRFYDGILEDFPEGLPSGLPTRMFSKILAAFVISAGRFFLESDEAMDVANISYVLSLYASQEVFTVPRDQKTSRAFTEH